MSEKNYTYIFSGKVFPERANVNYSKLNMAIKWKDYHIKGMVSILLSQITARFSCDKKIVDILTFRNIVSELIRFMVDTVGYTNGCGYDIEITSCIDSEDNITIFGVNIENDIENFSKQRPCGVPEIIQLANSEYGPYLRFSFSDLRESIKNPSQTGFFCFRAIESLRQYFVIKYSLRDHQSWEKFRNCLNIERDKIDYIKNFSDPVRHGNRIHITSKERLKVMADTWDIVDNYVEYGLQNLKQCNSE